MNKQVIGALLAISPIILIVGTAIVYGWIDAVQKFKLYNSKHELIDMTIWTLSLILSTLGFIIFFYS